MKGFNAPSGSAHEDIDFNNYTMRQRARMLYMAAPIATSAIKTNRTNVVASGSGLKAGSTRSARTLTGSGRTVAERNRARVFPLGQQQESLRRHRHE